MVQLHVGVMSHAAARRLDKAGWTLSKEEVQARVEVRLLQEAYDELNGKLEVLTQRMRAVPVVGRIGTMAGREGSTAVAFGYDLPEVAR